MKDTGYQALTNVYAAINDVVENDQLTTDIVNSIQNYGVRFEMQPYATEDGWRPYTKADFANFLERSRED